MKENGRMTANSEKDMSYSQMETNMKDIMSMEKVKVWALTHGRTRRFIRANG
jgi:hypothetical protein